MHTKCPECNTEFTPENYDEIKTLRAKNARYRKALEDVKTNIPWALIEHIKKLSEEALKGGE